MDNAVFADGYERAERELQSRGLLLEGDSRAPSVASLVIGGEYRGSWWSHPLCNEIYVIGRRLADRRDVVTVKLLSGKITYVHRQLWSALYAIGTSREEWQIFHLNASARDLLQYLSDRGAWEPGTKVSQDTKSAVAALESRLLAIAHELHSASGFHFKRLESWGHWVSRVSFRPDQRISTSAARDEFDQIVKAINATYRAKLWSPWEKVTKSVGH